jgi:hypothetical protein
MVYGLATDVLVHHRDDLMLLVANEGAGEVFLQPEANSKNASLTNYFRLSVLAHSLLRHVHFPFVLLCKLKYLTCLLVRNLRHVASAHVRGRSRSLRRREKWPIFVSEII